MHTLKFIYRTGIIMVLLGTLLWKPLVGRSVLPTSTASVDSVAIDSLLVRISHASEKVSYSGVQMRIVRHKGKPVTLRWQEYRWHPERTVMIFLAPEDVRNYTLVIKGDEVKYRSSQHTQKRFRYGGHKDLLKNGQIFKEIALLRRNYRVHASPGQPFLHRSTISLTVMPRYQDRPALNAIVDEKSGLLLQVNRKPVGLSSDSLIVVNQFIEISYENPDSNIFRRAWSGTEPIKKRRKATVYSDLHKLMTSHKGEILIPQKLPAGFALLKIKSIQRKGKSFLHFLYGDGLTFISLFQSTGDREPSHKKGYHKKAERHSPFVIIRGKQDSIAYSIVGEIPRAELAEMAESLGAR